MIIGIIVGVVVVVAISAWAFCIDNKGKSSNEGSEKADEADNKDQG